MKKIVWVLCFLVLTGCAGLADYTISLNNGYRIDRLSAHQIAIYGEEPVNDERKNMFNYLYVPGEVTGVWSDEDYIVAKQLHLTNGEPPKNPIENDYSYWIIEVHQQKVHGPMALVKMENEMNRLVGKNITFTSIEQLELD